MSSDDRGPTRRGNAVTSFWQAECKDCLAEGRAPAGKQQQGAAASTQPFQYSHDWVARTAERGGSRSDRCPRHRRAHRQAIRAISVAYIDLATIGEVADPGNPNGPLGGLGPLPVEHSLGSRQVNLNDFDMALGDDDILRLLEGLKTKRVAVVKAATGTGKSTLMPFRLMSPPAGAARRLNDFGPIIVTEPRRAAATDVAAFVGERMCFGHDERKCRRHIGPGFPVGYQVKGEKHWDDACQLIYVTDGTLINWVREGRLARLGAIIVDEAHERSENIDLILAQLRDQIDRFPHLRLIITSATLDEKFFIAYFGGKDRVHYQNIDAEKRFGYGVPLFIGAKIDESIIEGGLTLTSAPSPNATDHEQEKLVFPGWPQPPPLHQKGERDDLRQHTRDLMKIRRPQAFDPTTWAATMPAAVAEQALRVLNATEYGDILGFLPTTTTINAATKAIRDGLGDRRGKVDVYDLLSHSSDEIKRKATESRRRGDRRRIVISSNLAETSLTVPGVRYVIDSGLICQSDWDADLARESFPIVPHSQSGIRQRWGRVGRNAPGWVFPLYTIEQFQALPRITPPGAAVTNLEQFYMKLIATGLEPSRALLPTNFEHEGVVADESAREYVTAFNLESRRALHALRESGVVDRDGHLTSYGRELERFSGPGYEAVALMLADQLACLPETALALAGLGRERLVGGEKGLLPLGREWPPAWRVHASRCHRALAVGCSDDLDLLLRIVSLWESAPDRAAWCNTWWVNAETVASVWEQAKGMLEPLSARMRHEVAMTVRPELAGRARAVLSRAMSTHLYLRQEGRIYRSAHEDRNLPDLELSAGALMDPGDRILVLNSFRLDEERSGDARQPLITAAVRSFSWATDLAVRPDEMGFELQLLTKKHLGEPSTTLAKSTGWLRAVLDAHPVGAILDVEVEKVLATERYHAKLVRSPFLRPAQRRAKPRRAERNSESGFDPNAPLSTRTDETEVPEEEAARILIQPEHSPDGPPPAAESAGTSAVTPGGSQAVGIAVELRVQASAGVVRFHDTFRAQVVGYSEPGPAVLVEPLPPIDRPLDPAQHPDLKFGDDIDVIVSGRDVDHEGAYVRLSRADGKGDFYLKEFARGVCWSDRAFANKLDLHARFKAPVVPGEFNDHVAVSLLPELLRSLQQDPHKDGFEPAVVVEPPNDRGGFIVQLLQADETRGIHYRFASSLSDLPGGRKSGLVVGELLDVRLGIDSGPSLASLPLSERLVDVLKRHPSFLNAEGDKVRPKPVRLPRSLVEELLRLDPDDKWQHLVWRFFLDSHHRAIVEARGIPGSLQFNVPTNVARRLADIAERIGKPYASKVLVEASGAITINGPRYAAASARSEIERVLRLPYAVATVPSDSVGKIVGKGGANIKALQGQEGIYNISISNDRVTVIGETSEAVRASMAAIAVDARSAEGVLTVPQSSRSLFTGSKINKKLNDYVQESGCFRCNNRADLRSQWIVQGPHSTAVWRFIHQAASRAPGVTGTVSERTLKLVEDGTGPAQAAPETDSTKSATTDSAVHKPVTGTKKTSATTTPSSILAQNVRDAEGTQRQAAKSPRSRSNTNSAGGTSDADVAARADREQHTRSIVWRIGGALLMGAAIVGLFLPYVPLWVSCVLLVVGQAVLFN